MRPQFLGTLGLALLFLLLWSRPGEAAEHIGVPEKGLDRLELVDGRVFQGTVGAPTPEGVPFRVAAGEVLVPAALVRRFRLFRDFDSTPQTPEEEAHVAKGLVKWDGAWMAASEATAHREREIAEVEARALATKTIEVGSELAPAGEEDEFTFWSEVTREETETCKRFAEVVRQHLLGVVKVPPRVLAASRGTKIDVYLVRRGEHAPSAKSGAARERRVVIEIPKVLPKGTSPEGGDELVSELLHLWGNINFPGWLTYGLRGYYKSARLENGKLLAGDPSRDQWLLLHELSGSTRGPYLSSVMRAGGGRLSFQFFTDRRETLLTWEIVHFLLHGQRSKYRTRFTGWISRLWPEPPAREVPRYDAEAAFAELRDGILKGLDDTALELAVRKHAEGLEIDDSEARLARALARIERGNIEGAAADLAALVTIGNDAPGSMASMRAFLRMPGSSAQALPVLDRLIAADPLRWEMRLERARLLEPTAAAADLRLAADLAAAFRTDQRGLLLDQWCQVPLIEPGLATTVEERARVDATLALLPLLLDEDGPGAASRRDLRRAELLSRSGRFEDAIALAVPLASGKDEVAFRARYLLAVAYAGLGDVKKSLATMRGSIMQVDCAPPAARVCLAQGNGKAALILMDACLEKNRIHMDEAAWFLWVRVAVAAGNLRRAHAIVAEGSKWMPPHDSWRLRELLPR